MFNDVKINGALHDVIEYMQEDGCEDLGEPITHNGKEYYISIERVHNKKNKPEVNKPSLSQNNKKEDGFPPTPKGMCIQPTIL